MIAEQIGRRQVACVKYVNEAAEEEAKRVNNTRKVKVSLADRNQLAKWLNQLGVPTPRWVAVPKGKKLPGFHFSFPVVVKPARGKKPSQICQNLKAVKEAVAGFERGSHVQQGLVGYTFMKVVVTKGRLSEGVPKHVTGVIRRALDLLVSLGVADFEMIVAVSSDERTVYIVP